MRPQLMSPSTGRCCVHSQTYRSAHIAVYRRMLCAQPDLQISLYSRLQVDAMYTSRLTDQLISPSTGGSYVHSRSYRSAHVPFYRWMLCTQPDFEDQLQCTLKKLNEFRKCVQCDEFTNLNLFWKRVWIAIYETQVNFMNLCITTYSCGYLYTNDKKNRSLWFVVQVMWIIFWEFLLLACRHLQVYAMYASTFCRLFFILPISCDTDWAKLDFASALKVRVDNILEATSKKYLFLDLLTSIWISFYEEQLPNISRSQYTKHESSSVGCA